MQQQAFSQMKSMRDVKKGQVTNYLQSVKNQIITFSEDQMIIDVMSQFSSQYETFLSENDINTGKVSELKALLAQYYENEFSKSSAQQDNRQSPDVNAILDRLDDKAIALQYYYYIKADSNPLGAKDKLDAAQDLSKLAAKLDEMVGHLKI